MTSVSSANAAPILLRVAAPAAPRSVEGVQEAAALAAATHERPPALANAAPAKPEEASFSTSATANANSAAAASKADLTRQVHELQSKMDKLNPALAFVVDQESGRATIQLTDRSTKEVIQQFPSEAAIRISMALEHYQKGKLISLKA